MSFYVSFQSFCYFEICSTVWNICIYNLRSAYSEFLKRKRGILLSFSYKMQQNDTFSLFPTNFIILSTFIIPLYILELAFPFSFCFSISLPRFRFPFYFLLSRVRSFCHIFDLLRFPCTLFLLLLLPLLSLNISRSFELLHSISISISASFCNTYTEILLSFLAVFLMYLLRGQQNFVHTYTLANFVKFADLNSNVSLKVLHKFARDKFTIGGIIICLKIIIIYN